MSRMISSSDKKPMPEELVRGAHERLVRELISLESFVTLCYVRLDLKSQSIRLVDCGHTKTIHYHSSTRKCTFLQGYNMPLGFTEQDVYKPVNAKIETGDMLFFYSDGVTEARNKAGEFFGEDHLVECILANVHLDDPGEIINNVRQTVEKFSQSDTFADDLTCVAVMIFDMSKLEFIDSSGCGVILSCLRKINSKDGDIKLFGLTKPVRTLFELIRMHRIFDIFNTKEEAVKAHQL